MDAHAGHYFKVNCHINDDIKDAEPGHVGAHVVHDGCKLEPLWVHVPFKPAFPAPATLLSDPTTCT